MDKPMVIRSPRFPDSGVLVSQITNWILAVILLIWLSSCGSPSPSTLSGSSEDPAIALTSSPCQIIVADLSPITEVLPLDRPLSDRELAQISPQCQDLQNTFCLEDQEPIQECQVLIQIAAAIAKAANSHQQLTLSLQVNN